MSKRFRILYLAQYAHIGKSANFGPSQSASWPDGKPSGLRTLACISGQVQDFGLSELVPVTSPESMPVERGSSRGPLWVLFVELGDWVTRGRSGFEAVFVGDSEMKSNLRRSVLGFARTLSYSSGYSKCGVGLRICVDAKITVHTMWALLLMKFFMPRHDSTSVPKRLLN